MNCNGFGLRSDGKRDHLVRESKVRDIDGVMIILLGAIWNTVNKNLIENKLKIISPNVMLNASDSGEELDMSPSYLKWGTINALWNTTNYVELDESTERPHG